MPRTKWFQEIAGGSLPLDLTVNPYITGDTQTPADWIHLPGGGTLTFWDGSAHSETITNAPPGFTLKVPVRKLISLSGASPNRILAGTGDGPVPINPAPNHTFQTVATMADLLALAGFQDGGLVSIPHRGIFSRTYNGGAWAGSDGITILDGVDGGFWVRHLIMGCPGANEVPVWFLDLDNGDDDWDGQTSLTPIKSTTELRARLGRQEIRGTNTPVVTVHIKGNSPADARHIFDPDLTDNALFYILGTRENTVGLAGTLTTYVTEDPATKTYAQFSWSGLPSTWTAGQFIALPSLGNVSMVALLDLGSKVALTADAVDLDGAYSVPGGAVAFQGYTFNRLASKVVFAPKGVGTLWVSDLEIGNDDPVDLHWIEVTGEAGAQVLFTGCRIYGVDNYNSYLGAAVGCYIVGWRNYGRDLMQGNGHASVGGAIYRVHEGGVSDIIDHTVLLGTASVDPGGTLLIEGSCMSYGVQTGWIVYGRMKIDGAYWTKNASVTVLQTLAGGVVTYADAAKIGNTGTAPPHLFTVPGATADTLPLVASARLSGIVAT